MIIPLLLWLLLVSEAITSDEDCFTYKRVCSSFCGHEYFTINFYSLELYASPAFESSKETVISACIASNYNHIYQIHFYSKASKYWNYGSSLTIYDASGNIAFSGAFSSENEKTQFFSLSRKHERGSSMKTSDVFNSGWSNVLFDDSSWKTYKGGEETIISATTVYYRVAMRSPVSFTALRISIKYMCGCIIYLEDGVLTDSGKTYNGVNDTITCSSSSRYHHFYVESYIISSEYTVICFSLHYLESMINTKTIVDIEVTELKGGTNDRDYYVHYDTSLFPFYSDEVKALGSINDFDITSYYGMRADTQYLELRIPNGCMVLTSFAVWFNTVMMNVPKEIILKGIYGNQEITISHEFIHSNNRNSLLIFNSFYNLHCISTYRFYVVSDFEEVDFYELYMGVGNRISSPVLRYSSSTINTIQYMDTIYMEPVYHDRSNCSINTPLAGLTVSPDTCILSGSVDMNKGTYIIIVSSMYPSEAQVTLTVNVDKCYGRIVSIERQYGEKYFRSEWFSIMNVNTEEIIYEVKTNTVQEKSKKSVIRMCITKTMYLVRMGGVFNHWEEGSYLSIYHILDNVLYERVRTRYDTQVGLGSSIYYNAHLSIYAESRWEHKTGIVFPFWYKKQEGGLWPIEQKGSYSQSPNQIHLYRMTDALVDITGLTPLKLYIIFRCGCVVYMNGMEVYRKNIIGSISSTTVATGCYSSVMYREISLPPTSAQTGENTIAIATFEESTQKSDSVFDCEITLSANNEVSGSMTGTVSSIIDRAEDLLLCEGNNRVSWNSITSISMDITLLNDRHEWFDVLRLVRSKGVTPPSGVLIMGRNETSSEWNVLCNMTQIIWWDTNTYKMIRYYHTTSYNKYRLLFPGSDSENGLSSILFMSDYPSSEELSYPPINMFVGSTSLPVLPLTRYYCSFSAVWTHPTLVIDEASGAIEGSLTYEGSFTATITAYRNDGVKKSIAITLDLNECNSDVFNYHIHRFYFYVPETPTAIEWSISIDESEIHRSRSGYYPLTQEGIETCLTTGEYTVFYRDLSSDLMNSNFYFVYQKSSIPLFYYALSKGNNVINKSFFLFYPVVNENSMWLLYSSTAPPPSAWNSYTFAPSDEWYQSILETTGMSVISTTYLRLEYTLLHRPMYNYRLSTQYTGGVAIYFNGNTIAVLNLPKDYSHTSYALSTHDFTKVNVLTFNSYLDKRGQSNVICVEYHLLPGITRSNNRLSITMISTDAMEYDIYATADNVYGSSEIDTEYSIVNAFDWNPMKCSYVWMRVGEWISWELINAEYVYANALRFVMRETVSMEWYLFGSRDKSVDNPNWEFISEVHMHAITSNGLLSAPFLLLSYIKYKLVISRISNEVDFLSISSIGFVVVHSDGAICEGQDGYVSVTTKHNSTARCSSYEYGYRTRSCVDGKFKEEQSYCYYYEPHNFNYPLSSYTFLVGSRIIPIPYSVDGYVSTISSNPTLPQGIYLNSEGYITGKPVTVSSALYTLSGTNNNGVSRCILNITVLNGVCSADGDWEEHHVNSVCYLKSCYSSLYFGFRRRCCVLVEERGKWQQEENVCYRKIVAILIIMACILGFSFIIMLIGTLSENWKKRCALNKKIEKPQSNNRYVKASTY